MGYAEIDDQDGTITRTKPRTERKEKMELKKRELYTIKVWVETEEAELEKLVSAISEAVSPIVDTDQMIFHSITYNNVPDNVYMR